MPDRYHTATTVALTAGAAIAVTHGITANGLAAAPHEVIPTLEHGASVGAHAVRITNKGTVTYSVVYDGAMPAAGEVITNPVTVRLDAVRWHSRDGAA